MAKILLSPSQLKYLMKKFLHKKDESYLWFKFETAGLPPTFVIPIELKAHVAFTILDLNLKHEKDDFEGPTCGDCNNCEEKCETELPMLELSTKEFEEYKAIHAIGTLNGPILWDKTNTKCLLEIHETSLKGLCPLIITNYNGIEIEDEKKETPKLSIVNFKDKKREDK